MLFFAIKSGFLTNKQVKNHYHELYYYTDNQQTLRLCHKSSISSKLLVFDGFIATSSEQYIFIAVLFVWLHEINEKNDMNSISINWLDRYSG